MKRYAEDALYVWGCEGDFKHFLPRILELLISSSSWLDTTFVDAWSVFERMTYSNWQEWPQKEQASIREYFHSSWQSVLDTDADAHDFSAAYDWLDAIACAETDLSSYLAQWLQSESIEALLNLARTLYYGCFEVLPGEKSSTWKDRTGQWMQITAWFHSDEVKAKLAKGKAQLVGTPLFEEIVNAESRLSGVNTSTPNR